MSSAAKPPTKAKKDAKPMATVAETLNFAFDCGTHVKGFFLLGFVSGIANGMVYPILAYLFSTSFSAIASSSNGGLSRVRKLAFTFMIIGVYAQICGMLQTWAFEIVAYHGTKRFRLEWFKALLRQDPAFFDVNNVGGIASQVGPSSNKYRRGMGRKFGEGIQFLTTGVGGICYALYISWRVALLVLALLPLCATSAFMVMKLNQTKGSRADAAYKTASGVAYSSVSAIKTVLSLNGVKEMIFRYTEATKVAYDFATGILLKQGFADGSMLGSFLLLYFFLTLYGTSLLYRDVDKTGCDPSNAVPGNEGCKSSGSDVFGAMLGVAFAAQGASQFGNFSEAFVAARVAAYEALKAINRKVGAPEEVIYRTEDDELGSTKHSRKSTEEEIVVNEDSIRAFLPKYEIDSSSTSGAKPKSVHGAISFKNVHFAYPTRPFESVLSGLTVDIEPGQVVAFVGPSGSGKSTVVGLLERFYDPKSGCITLDGVNLKDINVSYLRSLIGYVGQEPTLFATTIRQNIQYSNPSATMSEIEEAARLANAHDFISSFPDGYDTQVGDKGSQLSGGQKQRIAIARVLVSSPKLLILDEATSALDAESEIVVQEALDNILATKKITTVIIAHRLSTIRNADRINVLVAGEVKESGTHDELMAKTDGYYLNLVTKQDGSKQDSTATSRTSSYTDLTALDEAEPEMDSGLEMGKGQTHIEFRNVTFSYPTRPNKIVLNEFNLKINKGQTIALCGPSGGGKSTTVGLIERFYDPVGGSIEFLGYDVKTLNVEWYRDQIGYVGQEPTLFNDSIAINIAFGAKGVTREDIVQAAKQANAYDFIMSFEQNFDTPVGERGTQLSGGQKQRCAIARALIRKPTVLLLDEATSALDNESEAIVQAAIDKLMQSKDQTVIVIAHRLSTIRNADVIAFIADGKVVELGSHDELIKKPHGRYSRLFESSKRDTTISAAALKGSKVTDKAAEDEEINWEERLDQEEQLHMDAKRARQMATADAFYIFVGAIGAVMAGGVFPMWGLMFSQMIDLLFQPVLPCSNEAGEIPYGFQSCEDYWSDVASDMKDRSFVVAGYWVIVLAGDLIGFVLMYWGFGTASERLNKRVRDFSFEALLRQEVAYFEQRSVGRITSQLQDDCARISAFSGAPVRSFLMAMASIVTGVVLGFVFMWQFALLAIGCIPIMGVATAMEMQKMLGTDESSDDKDDSMNSPGGILIETLLNIRTVAALTLEEQRYRDYENALIRAEANYKVDALISGLSAGAVMFVQQWINALQMWFGGWLLFTFPEQYVLKDFLIANFAVLFALFGLGSAFQDVADRKEVEKSVARIFYLLDRKSAIDPLSNEGKKLN